MSRQLKNDPIFRQSDTTYTILLYPQKIPCYVFSQFQIQVKCRLIDHCTLIKMLEKMGCEDTALTKVLIPVYVRFG